MLYQLAYLLQQGIAEWDSGTTYYTNSVVQNGGSIYIDGFCGGQLPPCGRGRAGRDRTPQGPDGGAEDVRGGLGTVEECPDLSLAVAPMAPQCTD